VVSDLNKLAEVVELDSVPSWIRQDIELKREEILQELQTKGVFVFRGPQGKEFTIKAKTKTATAA